MTRRRARRCFWLGVRSRHGRWIWNAPKCNELTPSANGVCRHFLLSIERPGGIPIHPDTPRRPDHKSPYPITFRRPRAHGLLGVFFLRRSQRLDSGRPFSYLHLDVLGNARAPAPIGRRAVFPPVRSMLAAPGQGAARRTRLDSRDRARRLPDHGPAPPGARPLPTRNGNDFTDHFPHIAEAIRTLNVRSCVIDGEAIGTDDKGLAVFELIRGHGVRQSAELCAFDLIELDGEDLRRTPIEQRKRQLANLLGRYQRGLVVNEFFEGEAQIIFDHACKLGCEGIVSKRLGSPCRAGRSPIG